MKVTVCEEFANLHVFTMMVHDLNEQVVVLLRQQLQVRQVRVIQILIF